MRARSLTRAVVADELRVLLQDFAEADDGVERRAQFVAHARQEQRLLAVGALGDFARLLQPLGCLTVALRLAGEVRLGGEHMP